MFFLDVLDRDDTKTDCISDFHKACAPVHETNVHVQHLHSDIVSEPSGLLGGAAMRWNKQY